MDIGSIPVVNPLTLRDVAPAANAMPCVALNGL